MFLARVLRRAAGSLSSPESSTPNLRSRAVRAGLSTSTSDPVPEGLPRQVRKYAKMEVVKEGAAMAGVPWAPAGAIQQDDPMSPQTLEDVELELEEKDLSLDAMMRQLQGSISSRDVEQPKLEEGAFLDPEQRDAGRVKEEKLRHLFRTFHDGKSSQDSKELANSLAAQHDVDATVFWLALQWTSLSSRAVEHQVSEKDYIKRAEWPDPVVD